MDIKTLESFSLGDAIFFHDDLNKNLWDMNNQLRPEVKKQLIVIAKDFIEELGVKDLDVKDITVSGSNAAYTYTKHSDLDLHILVDMDKLPENEVYRELFTAKKNLYNDSHDIKVHGVPVELYVQDSNEPVVSLGEYSILKDKWLRIPTKRRANFDQTITKQKYKKLLDLIEKALKVKDIEKVENVISTIKRYRKAGLDRGGEFGPENLAYKALRTQGYIDKLYDLRDKLHSVDLSINEVFNTKPSKKNSAYWEHEGEEGSTLHFEASNGLEYRLDIIPMWMGADEARPWEFADTTDEQEEHGRYVEFSQVGSDWVKDITGTGSSAEIFGIVSNGILQYVKKFKPPFLMMQAAEMNRRRLYNAMLTRLLPLMPGYKSMGSKADGMYFIYDSRVIKPKVSEEEKPKQASKSAIYSTDVYGMTAYHSKCLEPGCDWESKRYDSIKLAQNAAQKHAQKHFKKGVAESASGYIPSNAEKNDPRFKTALTVDIKPDTMKKNAKAFGNKISRAGIPPTLNPSGKF